MKKKILMMVLMLLLVTTMMHSPEKAIAAEEGKVQIWSNTHNERIEHRSIAVGDSNPNFSIRITPEGTAYGNALWTTNNTATAEVTGDESGATVQGKAEGSTRLNLSVDTTKYGRLSYDCIISIYTPINDVSGKIKKATKLYRGADSDSWVRTEKVRIGQSFVIKGSCGDYYYITMPDDYKFDDERKQREAYVAKSDVHIPVTSIKVSKDNIVMKKNESEHIQTELLPELASDRTYVYKTTNGNIAMVDQNGMIKSTGEGFAVVSSNATTDGKTAECRVSVYSPINPVNGTTMEHARLYEGADTSCRIRKDNAGKNEKLKVIGKCGNFYYVEMQDNHFGEGDNRAFISKSDVYIPVERIELSESNLILNINQKKKIMVKIYPEIATDKSVRFYSKMGNAKVDVEGIVSVSRLDEDIIWAETKSGITTNECTVQVLSDKIIEKLDPQGTFKISSLKTDLDGNHVTFSKCKGASEYIVFRKGRKGGWKDIYYIYNNDSKNQRHVFDMGAKPGEKYSYKVLGYYKYITYENGRLVTKRISKAVESGSITTGEPTLNTKIVRNKKKTITYIQLNWNKMSYDYGGKHQKTEYELQRKEGKGKRKKIKTFNEKTLSYKDKNVKKNKEYTYYLRAFYKTGKKNEFPEKKIKIKTK